MPQAPAAEVPQAPAAEVPPDEPAAEAPAAPADEPPAPAEGQPAPSEAPARGAISPFGNPGMRKQPVVETAVEEQSAPSEAPAVEAAAPDAAAPAEAAEEPVLEILPTEEPVIQLVDTEGEILDMASQESADLLASGDPYWMAGVQYYSSVIQSGLCFAGTSVAGGTCFISATPIQNAIDLIAADTAPIHRMHQFLYNDYGVIPGCRGHRWWPYPALQNLKGIYG